MTSLRANLFMGHRQNIKLLRLQLEVLELRTGIMKAFHTATISNIGVKIEPLSKNKGFSMVWAVIISLVTTYSALGVPHDNYVATVEKMKHSDCITLQKTLAKSHSVICSKIK